MISGFQTAVAEGKKRGLTVCFETTPHDELALSSAKDCGTVLNAVNGLKLVFDTANMLPAGEAPLTKRKASTNIAIFVVILRLAP